MTAPTLATDRLVLRGHAPDDLDALTRLWNDPAVYARIGGAPRSREEVWRRLLRSIGHWAAFGYGSWIVEHAGQVVGEVGLLEARRAITPPIDDAPENSWVLAPTAQGRGLAREAVGAALGWADAHGIPRTCCIIDPGNAASIALAGTQGYRERCRASYAGRTVIILDRYAAAG